MTSRLSFSAVLLLISITIYTQSAVLWELIGRANIDKTRLVKWANSKALNNDDCKVIHSADACEDVKIHYASNTAFLACGDPVERTNWYPCAGVRHMQRRAEASFREQLFKYDIKTGVTTQLILEGLDGDFITHGIDIYSFPNDPTKVSKQTVRLILALLVQEETQPLTKGSQVHIFAVNHGRAGDSIEIFSHRLGSDTVDLVKKVTHPNIKTANGVSAMGPL